MYVVFKDFAGPVATIIAAIAAGYWVYQFNTAQLRLTETGLILNLFDRRWKVVQELWAAVGEIVAFRVVSDETLREYDRAKHRAKFLFGPEVSGYLETIDKAIERFKDELNSDDEVRRRAADGKTEAFKTVRDFFNKFDPLVAPYMQMHQKLRS